MGYKHANHNPDREISIQHAIIAIGRLPFRSIRAIAAHFELPYSTLQQRHQGRQSRNESHTHLQLLSDAKESALAKWVTCQSAAGFLMTPALLKESAQEILNQRIRRASFQDPDPDHDPNLPPQLPIIGHEWLYRFQTRHSNLISIHSNSLDSSRFREANPVNINAWFDAYQL